MAKKPKLGSGARFAAVEKSAAASGAENPAAVAASAGIKKYGKKKMQKLAQAGKARKRGAVDRSGHNPGNPDVMTGPTREGAEYEVGCGLYRKYEMREKAAGLGDYGARRSAGAAHTFGQSPAGAHGFGHAGAQRSGHHRLSGHAGAHRIGRR